MAVSALLIAFNIAAWLWVLAASREFPLLMGAALLAYGLGLRHAFDADHIAAIDNVTRKLVWDGRRPVAVGLFFALGHSTIVVGFSCVVALAMTAFETRLDMFRNVGGAVGAGVSILFLSMIAVANCLALISVWKTLRSVKAGAAFAEEDLDRLLAQRGVLGRLFGRFVAVIGQSWQMYPLGLLFALGFDSATEVGLLGLSATEATQRLPIWSIMMFPVLFTAGMTLVDTADGVLMLGAYGWAVAKPIRKLYYNLTITAASVVAAAFVVGLQTLNLIARGRGPAAEGFWSAVEALNGDFGLLGGAIVGVLAACWLIFFLVFRIGRAPRREAANA